MTNDTETANGLGQEAFENGLHAPAQDKQLMNMLRVPVGGRAIELMAAWKKGWENAQKNTPEYKKMVADVFGVNQKRNKSTQERKDNEQNTKFSSDQNIKCK